MLSLVLSADINRCLHNENFQNNLKYADITPTFKTGNHLSKDDYTPISILPTLSEVNEKLLCDYLNYPPLSTIMDESKLLFLSLIEKST